MDIETAGAEIYGVPLGDFTARRTALSREAKASGDKELAKTIAGLRKPTTSAWVVNMLARHRADRVEQIAALGEELRDAQDALDAPRLRELGKQRSALVREVTREAVALAEELGTAASAAVSEEVAQTLQTAMIDTDAAALVASGTLVKPLTAAGWGIEEGGDVIAFPTATQRAGRRIEALDAGAPSEGTRGGGSTDEKGASSRTRRGAEAGGSAGVTGAKGGGSAGSTKASASGGGARGATAGAPDASRPSTQERKREAERKQAERDLAKAEAALAEAREEAEELRASAEAVAERRASLREEVQELTRQLREAEGELADAEGEARGIRRSRDEAKRAVTAAERAVARARRRLD